MATYKVPQDVEADDKLIGPFSFRQFIYLIVVALAGALAWGLSQLFIGLAVIPLPIILFFGALALPLRKDQPMEIYLAALVSFYIKPHKRLWDPDGIESLIEITAPKVVVVDRTKGISQADADQRFSYLANIVDSQGWAIRGAGTQAPGAINNDIYLEAQGADDVLDANNSVAQSFDSMMSRETDRMRQEAVEKMRQITTAPTAAAPPAPQPVAPAPNPFLQPTAAIPSLPPTYNPYPDIQQSVIQPINDPSHAYTQPVETPAVETPPTTSDKPVSADIMNLANNSDLSIETIAHEARRIKERDGMQDEVVISLR